MTRRIVLITIATVLVYLSSILVTVHAQQRCGGSNRCLYFPAMIRSGGPNIITDGPNGQPQATATPYGTAISQVPAPTPTSTLLVVPPSPTLPINNPTAVPSATLPTPNATVPPPTPTSAINIPASPVVTSSPTLPADIPVPAVSTVPTTTPTSAADVPVPAEPTATPTILIDLPVPQPTTTPSAEATVATATPLATEPPTALPATPVPTQNLSTLTWLRVEDAPRGLYEAQGASIGNRLYIVGGFYNKQIQTITETMAYDLVERRWIKLADAPEKLTHAGQAVDDRTLYIAGGFLGDHPGPSSANVWAYDSISNTWRAMPPLPAARGGGALVRVGRNLHYFGGVTRTVKPYRYVSDHADHWVLNLDNEAAGWAPLAPMPNPRNHMAGVELNGKIYALSGQHLNNEPLGNQNMVNVYDPATDTWSNAAPLPLPLSHVAASTFTFNGRIIVIAGVTNDDGKDSTIWSIEVPYVFAYDPATNIWERLTDAPHALQSPVAAAIGNTLVLATGEGGGGGISRITYIGTFEP